GIPREVFGHLDSGSLQNGQDQRAADAQHGGQHRNPVCPEPCRQDWQCDIKHQNWAANPSTQYDRDGGGAPTGAQGCESGPQQVAPAKQRKRNHGHGRQDQKQTCDQVLSVDEKGQDEYTGASGPEQLAQQQNVKGFGGVIPGKGTS